MLDPYRMVVVNVVAFFSLLCFLGILKFVFHRNIKPVVVLLLFSLLPLISILRKGAYESGDFDIHIYRAIAYYSSFKEGILLPSWAEDLNGTFGYGAFIFLNPLPYYIISFVHFLGFSFINSMKIFLIFSYISSGIFFYFFAKKEVKSEIAAFCGAIIYLYTPYHFVDLHFRSGVGELTFFMFFPLFFYFFSSFLEYRKSIFLIISSLCFAILMLSHQAMTILSLVVILPYTVYFSIKKKPYFKNFLYFCIPLSLGMLYSLYSWLPHILYSKYTSIYLLNRITVLFPNIHELFYSSWTYGFLFQGHKGELSPLIGYTQILLILIGLYVTTFGRKKVSKDLYSPILLWMFIIVVLFFMMTSFSAFFWNLIPTLNSAQFSTRLLLLITFSISILSAYLAKYYQKKKLIIVLFIFISIAYTILNWGNRKVLPAINDDYLINNLPYSSAQGEGLNFISTPKWIMSENPWKNKIPISHLEFLSGKGEIFQIKRTSTIHEYFVSLESDSILKENTLYFPGWSASLDGKRIDIDYTNRNDPGIMFLNIPKGIHKIKISYKDLEELHLAKIISLISFSISIILLLFLIVKNNHKKSTK